MSSVLSVRNMNCFTNSTNTHSIMARLSLLDGTQVILADHKAPVAIAALSAGHSFENEAELEEFLGQHSDLTGSSRPPRFLVIQKVQERLRKASEEAAAKVATAS